MPGSTSTAPNFRFRRCAKSSVYLGAATTHGADGPKVFAPSAGSDGSVAFMSCSCNLVDCTGVPRSQRSCVRTGNGLHKRRSHVSCESTGFGVVPYASTKRQRIRSIVIPCMRTSSISVLWQNGQGRSIWQISRTSPRMKDGCILPALRIYTAVRLWVGAQVRGCRKSCASAPWSKRKNAGCNATALSCTIRIVGASMRRKRIRTDSKPMG